MRTICVTEKKMRSSADDHVVTKAFVLKKTPSQYTLVK